MGRHMVTTNTQDLGIARLELAIRAPERDGLLGSTTGKIEHVK